MKGSRINRHKIKIETRDYHLDLIKLFAIVEMVIFHFFYDLGHFKVIDINVANNLFFVIWRYFIVSPFLFAVGVAMVISYQNHSQKSKTLFLVKCFISNRNLALYALIVSISTYILIQNIWIYFGILHAILLAKFLFAPVISMPKLNFVLAIIIIGLSLIYGTWHPFQPWVGQGIIPKNTADILNILPWFSMIALGIVAGHYPIYRKIKLAKLLLRPSIVHKVKYLSKNSLHIYILHQAILFPLVYLISII